MNGLNNKKDIAIDDESIAKPPYPGPDDEPLPDIKLSKNKITIALNSLFVKSKQIRLDKTSNKQS